MGWVSVLQEENCIARECMLAGKLYCNMVVQWAEICIAI